jgi:hypothetical protein
MLGGGGWSLAAICDWRLSKPGVNGDRLGLAKRLQMPRVGHQILAVDWNPALHGIDPSIALDGGLSLELFDNQINDSRASPPQDADQVSRELVSPDRRLDAAVGIATPR